MKQYINATGCLNTILKIGKHTKLVKSGGYNDW
jgi:hypothetical protein